MIDVATLSLAVDSRQVAEGSRALDQLAASGGKAEAATKSLTRATEYLGAAVKTAVAAFAAYKLADLVRDSAMLAARFETMGVVMRIAGNNAGYTAAQMESYSKALQASGISMIESRNAVTQLATAQIDLTKAQVLGRAAQNLAVVANVDSSEALARLIHGIKSGQVEILRTLGLNVNFEASYRKLAASLGTTTDKLTENQKMMARTNASIEEAKRANEIYEEAMDTAGKAIGSLTRYWKDFKTMAGDAFLPLLADGVFALTDALKAANTQLDKMGSAGTIQSIGESLAGALRVVGKYATVVGANVAWFFNQFGTGLGAIAAMIERALNRDFAGVKQIWRDFSNDTVANIAAVNAFSASMLKSEEATAKAAKTSEEERIAAGKAARAAAEAEAKRQAASEQARAASKRATEQYDDLVRSLRDKLAMSQAELAAEGALTDAQKLRIETESKLAAIRKIFPGISTATAEALARELGVTLDLIAAKEHWLKLEGVAGGRYADAIDAREQATQSILDATRAMRESTAEMGLEADELLALRQARIDDEIAIERRKLSILTANDVESEATRAIRAQIAALEDRKRALAEQTTATKAIEAAKKTAEEWKRGWEETDRIARDAFTAWATEGGSAAKKIGETLKKSLLSAIYEATLKPLVFRIYGSVTNALGIGGAGATANSAGNLLGTASNAASLAGLFGNSMSMGNVAGTLYANATGGGLDALLATNAAFGTAESATLGSSIMSSVSGALSAIPVWGWAAMAALAVWGFMGKGGGPKTEGDAFGMLDAMGAVRLRQTATTGDGVWYTGGSADATVAQMLSPIGGALNTIVKRLGGSAAGIGVNLGYNTDPAGTAPDNVSAASVTPAETLSGTAPDNVSAGVTDAAGNVIYRRTYDVDRGGAQAALALEIQKMQLAGIKAAAGIDKIFTDIVDGVDLATASADQLNAAFQQISDTADARAAFKVLGLDLAGLTSELIAAAGGAVALKTQLADYYMNFYSEAERNANTLAAVGETLGALGLALPATREGFRALVEAQDLTTSAGRDAFAALMSVSSAFAQVIDAADAAAGSIAGLTKTLGDSLDAQIKASQSAAQAARQSAESYRALAVSLSDTVRELRGGDLSPLSFAQRLAESRDALDSVFGASLSGDTAALAKLPDVATEFLNASRDYNASSQAYTADFNRVMDMLAQAGVASGAFGGAADYQATLLEIQTETLREIKETLAQPSPDAAILAEQKALLATIADTLTAHTGRLITINSTLTDQNGQLIAGNALVSAQTGQIVVLGGMTIGEIAAQTGQVIAGNTLIDAQTGQVVAGNATSDAIKDISAANTSLSEEMLRSLVTSSVNDTSTFAAMLAGISESVGLLGQLAELAAQKSVAEAQATVEADAAASAAARLTAERARLDTLLGTQQSLIASVNSGIAGIEALASTYGLSLQTATGGKARFYVDDAGLFQGGDYQQIAGNPANFQAFKNEFYRSGGVYEQTYGQAAALRAAADAVAAQRSLIDSLPGHAAGLASVPYDGYAATLHKDEAVIDAATMAQFRRYGINVQGMSKADIAELVAAVKEARDAILYAAASSQRAISAQTVELKQAGRESAREMGNAIAGAVDARTLA